MPRPEFPVLGTERLLLREMVKSDAGPLVALLHDEEVSRWALGNLERTTLKGEQGYIRAMRKQFLKGQLVSWIICDKVTGALMGCIGLQPIDRTHNRASAGFMLGREFWGRGYMTEAFAAVLEYAFGTLGSTGCPPGTSRATWPAGACSRNAASSTRARIGRPSSKTGVISTKRCTRSCGRTGRSKRNNFAKSVAISGNIMYNSFGAARSGGCSPRLRKEVRRYGY
ncbi:MAG: GNAT family N-acetyltransferase [Oscillospiraceae bacterium]|nr:GNAT family N-acetyltransferase [Oscillospiraceae bacterium]